MTWRDGRHIGINGIHQGVCGLLEQHRRGIEHRDIDSRVSLDTIENCRSMNDKHH